MSWNVSAADPFPRYVDHVLDAEIGKVCYAVTLADVDGDSLLDVVAVSEDKVLWYQNPTWKKRVIIDNQTPLDNVCIAPFDIDGDGHVDFALGAGWTKNGSVHWLQRRESLDEPWKVHLIGEERWVHRMSWGDVLGQRRPQLVVSPLNASVAEGVRLTAFAIPADPVKDRWTATVLNAELNRMHNHTHLDLGSKGIMDTITASREGINLIRPSNAGWLRTKLGSGTVADDPNLSGAGEIKVGKLANGSQFLTAVEPMHGHTLAVYTAPKPGQEMWDRHIVETGFQRGHALWTADMNGDGNDEIVFGHSDTPDTFGVIVFECLNATGTKWGKHVVDSGRMATEDLIVGDVTGDGRPDIIAGGRATHNLKLYVNTLPHSSDQ